MAFHRQHFSKPNVFKPIATGNVRDENINFESDRTSSMSEKTKQSLPSEKVLNHIPSYQSNLILIFSPVIPNPILL